MSKNYQQQINNTESSEEDVFYFRKKQDNIISNLFDLICLDKPKKVEELFQTTPDIWEYKNQEGVTALYKAIQLDNTQITISIINILRKKMTDLDFVKYINTLSNKGYYLIQIACLQGNLEIVKCLIESGADVNIETNFGLNNLHIACHRDQLRVVIYLIEVLKFNPQKKDNQNNTALHWSCYYGSELCIKYLVSKINKNEINDRDINGWTLLHLSVLTDRISIIKFLLHSGIDYKLKNNGKTALDLAIENNYTNSISILSNLDNSFNNCLKCSSNLSTAKKTNVNIYMFYIYHIVFELLLFMFILPCKILT